MTHVKQKFNKILKIKQKEKENNVMKENKTYKKLMLNKLHIIKIHTIIYIYHASPWILFLKTFQFICAPCSLMCPCPPTCELWIHKKFN